MSAQSRWTILMVKNETVQLFSGTNGGGRQAPIWGFGHLLPAAIAHLPPGHPPGHPPRVSEVEITRNWSKVLVKAECRVGFFESRWLGLTPDSSR